MCQRSKLQRFRQAKEANDTRRTEGVRCSNPARRLGRDIKALQNTMLFRGPYAGRFPRSFVRRPAMRWAVCGAHIPQCRDRGVHQASTRQAGKRQRGLPLPRRLEEGTRFANLFGVSRDLGYAVSLEHGSDQKDVPC